MALSKRNITIIIFAFITVFFDTMNYALIVPILPYLVKELNSNSFQEGLLFSSYSIFQLISIRHNCFFSIGLLIMGPLSDKYGRKPFLLLSLFGSCFGSDFTQVLNFRIYLSRNVSRYVEFDYLEIIYGIVCWISHSCSSVRIVK